MSKNPKKYLFSLAGFALSFCAPTNSLVAAQGCSRDDLLAILQTSKKAVALAEQQLEGAKKKLAAAKQNVEFIEAKLAQLGPGPEKTVISAENPSKETKTLSNGATLSLVHGDPKDVPSQVWRDGDMLWGPVANRGEFSEYTKQHPLTYDFFGTKYPDYPAMAKAYCEALKIPGLEGVKWVLPELDVFLKAAGNSAENVGKQVNKFFFEAFPKNGGLWFWTSSSSTNPFAVAGVLVFQGHSGEVYSFGANQKDIDVRCVSRAGT